MLGRSSSKLCFALAIALPVEDVDAGNERHEDTSTPAPIVEVSPTLAPFQHVRFCLRYPRDCQANSREDERIRPNPQVMNLLKSVNDRINQSIVPSSKDYYRNLDAGWVIAPSVGDCNDYAITKRHELLMSGLPSSALRLSVVKTPEGIGHLVLVVITTKGNLVMDNLTEAIRLWQFTDYKWLKIQSANDPRFWTEVKSPQADQNMRVAGRSVDKIERAGTPAAKRIPDPSFAFNH